jgi:hypothetical protein
MRADNFLNGAIGISVRRGFSGVMHYWPKMRSVSLQLERKIQEPDVPSRYSKSFWRTTHDNAYLVGDYFHKIYRELQTA